MAPLVLKLHTVSNIFKDLNVDPDELHDTWRVCTKAKKALEHGSRLENISWRRWFLHVKKQTHCSSHSPQDNLTTTTTTTATTTALTLLERQYKRNLLVQQQKQCQQMLEATATKPAVFVDNQYQPPPTTSTSVCSTTSSSSGILTVSTLEEDEPLTTCLSDSFPPLDSAPFDDDLLDSHPAMYVASDEQPPSLSLLHQQGASSPFSMVTPMHPISNIASSASASPLASYLTTTTTTKHHNNNIRIKKKAKKHRVRCPLPVINANANGVSVCDDCGTCSTPLWRRYQNKNLCNACGLYWKLHNSPRPIHLIPSITDPNNQLPQCTNCGTMTTPLWRRHEIDGSPLCNACGLYAKLHQETRPLSMKTNVIKKRQRLS
ncbi:hypothetical protein [Absidia glauca]|uniref:GATA-type domain-containing protein n=1 Tax=Absidia glauca TaxID=4829 RepID=A0A168LKL3_ABSGL|nr:hypothetical protein [Absidia glauca]